MKIIPVSFKSNIETPKSDLAQAKLAQPQANQIDELKHVAMEYNIRVPIKYSYLGEKKLPNDLSAHIYKLENGQNIVIVPSAGATTINTFVNSGSMNEPDDKRGISHFIEHNLFNGSQGFAQGEIFKKASSMGASLNASTGFAQTDYYIQSHLLKEGDLEEKIKMHSAMLNTPRFALNMIEKEKGPVTSEINMVLDSPQNIAVNETTKMLYNIKSTSTDMIGGSVDNINRLTRDDVIDYYNKNYCPSNRSTVITGEVTQNEVMALVSKYFNAKNTHRATHHCEKLVPIDKTIRKDLRSSKTNEAVIIMGFDGPQNSNTKDKVLMSALGSILFDGANSKVNKNLLKYNSQFNLGVEKISTKPDDGRMVLIEGSSGDENCEQILKVVFEEIQKFQNTPPTQKELDIIKQKLKIEQASAFDNNYLINLMLGQAMLDGDINSVAEFDKIIDEMTVQDLVGVAKKYLDLSKTAITVVHPAKASNVAFTGANKKKTPIYLDKIKDYQLKNNLNLITNQVSGNLSVMDLTLNANIPPDVKIGTKELFLAMLYKGTASKSQSQLAQALDENGIIMKWQADERSINVSANCTPEKLLEVLKLAKEIILTPRFDAATFEAAKKELKMELENSLDYAQDGIAKELLGSLFSSKDELLANLDKLTLEDVKGLHQYILQKSSAQCVISADFNKNENLKPTVVSELSKDFGQFKPNSPYLFTSYTPTPEAKTITRVKPNNQAEIVKAYKFKITNNLEDSIKFELLNEILAGGPSSLLFQDLREVQKLAYRVGSEYQSIDDTGVFNLSILTTTDNPETGEFSPENVRKSIAGFDKHTKNLMETKIDESILENAKLALKSNILDQTATTNGKTATIADSKKSFYGLNAANQMLEFIDKVTVDDIQSCAKYVFANHPVTAIYASEKTLDNLKTSANS